MSPALNVAGLDVESRAVVRVGTRYCQSALTHDCTVKQIEAYLPTCRSVWSRLLTFDKQTEGRVGTKALQIVLDRSDFPDPVQTKTACRKVS